MVVPVGRIIDRERSRSTSGNLVFPEDIGPHGMLFIFREYTFDATRNRSGFGFSNPNLGTVGDTILLPLPQSLQDRMSINVQGQQLGIFGESIGSVAGSTVGANSAESAGNSALSRIQNMMPSMSSLRNAGVTGAEQIASLFGSAADSGQLSDITRQSMFLMRAFGNNFLPTEVGRGIDAGLGSVVNPRAALAFDGVPLKNHSLDWQLAPKTRRESDQLKDIFKTFRRNALPEYLDVTLGTDSSVFARGLLKYPSLVDIFLLGVDPSYYLYYKTSMINDITINFTPNHGHSILSGGKPAIVGLSIQLIESDIHTAGDYSNTTTDPSTNLS